MIWVDIAIEHNITAIKDAINATKHEILVRQDLKKTISNISLRKDVITFTADNKNMLKQVVKIFEEKLKNFGGHEKVLIFQEVIETQASAKQKAVLQRIFDTELTNQIVGKINQLTIPIKIDARSDRIILSADTSAKIQNIQDALRKYKFKLPIVFRNYHENVHPENIYELFTTPKK